jgi:hypoxanthine phosphoribosyltransferase
METEELELIHGPRSIKKSVTRLASEIDRDHKGGALTLVAVLKGSFVFLADLARALRTPVTIEFIRVASYRHGKAPGELHLLQDIEIPLRGRSVVLVDDIVDSGRTSHFLMRRLRRRRPLSCRLCALLDKPSRREVDLNVDYLGFTIPDTFVVGYGLDFNERYRQLPGLYSLRSKGSGSP